MDIETMWLVTILGAPLAVVSLALAVLALVLYGG